MVEVDVPRNYFEFSSSRIAKTALVKIFVRNLKDHILRRETMKSVYFETFLKPSSHLLRLNDH